MVLDYLSFVVDDIVRIFQVHYQNFAKRVRR